MFGIHKPVKTQSLMGGTQHEFKFDNGYGASVISHQYSYGGPAGLWELGVLDDRGVLTYDTPITGDVLGWLTEQDVADALDRVAGLPAVVRS